MAIRIARSNATMKLSPSRDYDVACFFGDGSRARAVLGWNPTVDLCDGLGRLMSDFRKACLASRHTEGAK